MNYTDSEKIIGILKASGYKSTDEMQEADVIIFNTCSVRQRAEDKVLGLARQVIKIKEDRPQVKVLMTGCMSQRVDRSCPDGNLDMKYLKKIQNQLDWVDEFIPIGDLKKIAQVLDIDNPSFTSSRFSEITADVPISIGCDNFCTYCVVPYTRGKEVYRNCKDIVCEVKDLSDSNYKMITLLGQNVNSWRGECDGEELKFPGLLERVSKTNSKIWFTFLTSHPKDFSLELARVVACNKNICNYINLPFQSGSDKILKKMNRSYKSYEYKTLIKMIRHEIPDVRLSTDIIVGFPGETEQDFEETFELFKYGEFEMAYISEYSPRDVVPSSKLEDDVSDDVKKERKKKLTKYLEEFTTLKNEDLVGETVKVLVKSPDTGTTFHLRDVVFEKDQSELVGEFVEGEVIEGVANGLKVRINV